MSAMTGAEPRVFSPLVQVKVLPDWSQATPQERRVFCRPLAVSEVRLLGAVTPAPKVMLPRGRLPSLRRVTARVMLSPGTRPETAMGRVPWLVALSDRVPVSTLALIGAVLSVKAPKVPRPATAAAAPRTPREPTTLRVVER